MAYKLELYKIIAEIKKENIQSIKAFQKAGFKESYVTYIFPY